MAVIKYHRCMTPAGEQPDAPPAHAVIPMPEIAVANEASLLLAIGTFIASLFVRGKVPPPGDAT